MWGDNVSVFPSPLHDEVPRYSPAIYHKGICWRRRFGYLRGMLSEDPEVGGIPVGSISGKVKHPRDTAGEMCVYTMEGEGGDCTVGTCTATAL